MDNDFVKLLKNIENGLLDLKTSKQFVGVNTARYSSTFMATAGRYIITYKDSGPIISTIYVENINLDKFVYVTAKTPVGNTQVIDVYIPEGVSANQPLKIVSNIDVESVSPL